MSDELSIREQLLSDIDELLVDLKESFTEYFTELPEEEFKASFAGDPLMSQLSVEALRPMLQEMINVLWKELEREFLAFSQHWKNQIPPEETLTTFTEGQIEALLDAGEEELDLVFHEALRKFKSGSLFRKKEQ